MEQTALRRALAVLGLATLVACLTVPAGSAVAAPVPAPGPVIIVDSHALAFGHDVVGVQSAAQTLHVFNRGTGAFTINALPVLPDYVLTTTCGASLAPKASCAIGVAHLSAVAGDNSTILPIVTSAGTVNVTLTSVGGPALPGAGLVVTPAAIEFLPLPVGQSTTKDVVYRNEGDADVILNPVATGAAFPFTTTCAAQLAPGATCFFSFTFTPTASATFSGQLDPIAVPSSGTATLTGQGLPAVDAADVGYTTPTATPLVVSDPNAGLIGLSSGFVVDFVSATAPSSGSLATAPDGTWTYTPAAGFSGLATFTYTVEDYFGLTAVGTMSITVGAQAAAAGGPRLATSGADALPTGLLGAGLLLAGILLAVFASRQGRFRAAHRLRR